MKLITAVVKPYKVTDIKDAVAKLGVHGMTVTESEGYGRQRGHTEVYRGAEYTVDFVTKARLEVLVDDDQLEQTLEAICTTAHTGEIGDGKIWVTPVEQVVRVSSGERGTEAI